MKEREERRSRTKMAGLIIAVTALAMLPIFGVACVGVYQTSIQFEYNSVVGTHIDAAHRARTPELLTAELIEAKNGMINLSLTPNMYSKVMSWNQKFQYSMEFQYQLIDSAIQRGFELIAWRDSNIFNDGNYSAEATDVYNLKMDNLKISVCAIDSIAYRTWLINEHPFFAYMGIPVSALIVWFLILGAYLYSLGDRYNEEPARWALRLTTIIALVLVFLLILFV